MHNRQYYEVTILMNCQTVLIDFAFFERNSRSANPTRS
jgi:hypothetical protein